MKIVLFPHLTILGELSPTMLIKLFLFLTLIVVFYSSYKQA